MGGAGADNTSALTFGGITGGVGPRAYTESWNDSAWTEVEDLNTARYGLAGSGTATSALGIAGGVPGSAIDDNEIWNGTAWTEGTDIKTARN